MIYTTFDSLHNPQGTRHTTTWADLAKVMHDVPAYPDKASQPLIKLGTFEGDSRGAGHSLTTISGVEIDYDAGIVTAQHAAQLFQSAGIECVVCSTYTSTPTCHKWRVFAPTSRELSADLRQYLVAALDSVLMGISARESYTPKQTFFFGRNPDTEYTFIHVAGDFVDLALRDQANAAYLADKADQREREQLANVQAVRVEATRNRKTGGRLVDGQISPITAFNEAYSVKAILTAHGYKPKGSKFVAPASQSGMAGVVILQGQDGRERAYSHHSSDAIADGLAHDAFDLYRILDHAGDEWAALLAAAKLMTTHDGKNLHLHNRNVYRQHRISDKTKAALDTIMRFRV